MNELKKPAKYIPVSLISPIVREYCDSREMGLVLYDVPDAEKNGVSNRGGALRQNGHAYSAIEALAFEADLWPRVVANIYNGHSKHRRGKQKKPGTHVTFRTADKLLTAMGLWYLWYEKPLSDYYYGKKTGTEVDLEDVHDTTGTSDPGTTD